MVGFGILVNKSDISCIGSEIASLRTELRGEVTGLRGEIGRVEKTLNDAVIMLVNIGNELDKHISRLEDKG